MPSPVSSTRRAFTMTAPSNRSRTTSTRWLLAHGSIWSLPGIGCPTTRRERLISAEAYVDKALKLQPDSAAAHLALGFVRMYGKRAAEAIAEVDARALGNRAQMRYGHCVPRLREVTFGTRQRGRRPRPGEPIAWGRAELDRAEGVDALRRTHPNCPPGPQTRETSKRSTARKSSMRIRR